MKDLVKIEKSKKISVFNDVATSLIRFIDTLKKRTTEESEGFTQDPKKKVFQRAFSPKCPNCDEGSMYELVYSHEVHQELYWCPKCGTLNMEVAAEPIILTPTLVQESIDRPVCKRKLVK